MNKKLIFFYVLLTYDISLSSCDVGIKKSKFKIAIIGGGIGGVSAAHYLNQELKHHELEVDMFIRSETELGGRIKSQCFLTQDASCSSFEIGASLIHSRNQYMKSFARYLNLTENIFNSTYLALWDGRRIRLATSGWSITQSFQMMWRFGLRNLFRLRSLMREILDEFDNIYKLQNLGVAFTNVETMLKAISPNFYNLTKMSLADFLFERGFNQKFVSELAAGALRNNYGGQNVTEVHAFVGLVSLMGSYGDTWSVKGGNEQIPRLLLHKLLNESLNVKERSSNEEVLSSTLTSTAGFRVIQAQVRGVQRTSADGNPPRFTLHLSSSLNKKNSSMLTEAASSYEGYDFVILAAPQNQADDCCVQLQNMSSIDGRRLTDLKRTFQRVTTTLVQGELNITLFKGILPNTKYFLLTTTPLLYSGFYSIGYQPDVQGTEHANVWKVFADRTFTQAQLIKLGWFKRVDKVTTLADWLAYPRYSVSPSQEWPHFLVSPNVVYVNAVEQAASAMEMSALAGRNAALMALNVLTGRQKLIDPSEDVLLEYSQKDEL